MFMERKQRLISCAVTAQLILAFVLAYVDFWFSCAMALIFVLIMHHPYLAVIIILF